MQASNSTAGKLTLVSTPIGNLTDLSPRAHASLDSATTIACEDTRVTSKLLSKLKIKKDKALLGYHDKNESTMASIIADRISDGENIVLVADAGTPTISDPGFRVVRECRKRKILVEAVPGVNAAITALSISGLPSDRFLFVGFLPPKRAARLRFFSDHLSFPYTIILYESCHRIEKMLQDLVETLGPDRCISVSRELTKLHETSHTGPAAAVQQAVIHSSLKGEFVVLVAKENYQL
ncbi:MAG: 16S rRNA (cytidine(1402)-2'-O)-methyltransferase [Opitutales bacterium]